MLKKSVSVLGIVLLSSSLALASQSTTTPVPAGPRVQSQPPKAPHHKQALKKHQKKSKKPVTPPPNAPTPPQ